MYEADSFFDLTPWCRFGLVCISLVLFSLTLILPTQALLKRVLWLRLLGSIFAFWLFVWLSPQVYYQYYWLIFPDLPQQLVIWSLPGPGETLSLVFFQGPHNLSAHGKGILAWCLIALQFFKSRNTQS